MIQQDKFFDFGEGTKAGVEFTELNSLIAAMYEHEVLALSRSQKTHVEGLKKRLNSLPHYINQAAYAMCHSGSPLTLDSQNATWIAQQPTSYNSLISDLESRNKWFATTAFHHGLILPVLAVQNAITQVFLDSIDKIDLDNGRVRTNRFGWFNVVESAQLTDDTDLSAPILLKPSKKVFASACAGHRWQRGKKINPARLSLRELLLSCGINWRNFKKTLAN